LKQGAVLDSYKLLENLGIDPKGSQLVRALSQQLDELEAFGLVTSTQRGWRWVSDQKP
jgi:hypothetical protein